MRLLLLIFCWGICFATYAQTSPLDSLKKVLQEHDEEDTTRVNILTQMADAALAKPNNTDEVKEYVQQAEKLALELGFAKGHAKCLHIRGNIHANRSEPKKALKYFNEALKRYESIDFQKNVAVCYFSMGVVYYYQSDFVNALKSFGKSREVAEVIKHQEGITSALNGIATTYSELDQYDKALKYYDQALQMHIKSQNKKGMATCYNNMGTVCDDQTNYPQATEYYQRALSLNQELGLERGISQCLNNLGIVYKKQEDYEMALTYYKKSEKLLRKLQNERGLGQSLNNIGLVYKRQGKIEQALKYLNQALKISRKVDYKPQISRCLINIANIEVDRQKFDLGYKYYQEALGIKQKIGDQKGVCSVYIGIGDIYAQRKSYAKSLEYVLKAKKLADKLGIKDYQSDVYEALAQVYGALGDYKKAYESHVAYKKLHDELFDRESIQKVTQLEYKYKYERKLNRAGQRERKLIRKVAVADLDLEKSQRQTLLAIIGFLGFIIVSGVIIGLLIFRAAKSERKQMLVEQKLLRSQMTPHFMFNSLSVLQGIILNKEYPKAITYLSKFARLLRVILENSRDKIVSLENELKAIEHYLVVQNLGTDCPYHYTIEVDESINSRQILIPPMMIQPFVENAIEHGFVRKKEDRQILVKVCFDDEKLSCKISDNGKGIQQQTTTESNHKKSLATTITAERLKIFAKEFKVKTNLQIQNREIFNEQGTLVTLDLPYKIKKDD
ncbi:hypothetical protein BKI52_29590 [marine bacterium AO1-C]|nr:hypothetical protein BKI52_29590 [marine bacterium AO1-C]